MARIPRTVTHRPGEFHALTLRLPNRPAPFPPTHSDSRARLNTPRFREYTRDQFAGSPRFGQGTLFRSPFGRIPSNSSTFRGKDAERTRSEIAQSTARDSAHLDAREGGREGWEGKGGRGRGAVVDSVVAHRRRVFERIINVGAEYNYQCYR